MSDEAQSITEEERRRLIEDFEEVGSATFRVGEDQARFEALANYIRENQVPTYTDLDRDAGTITLSKRPWGSLEFH